LLADRCGEDGAAAAGAVAMDRAIAVAAGAFTLLDAFEVLAGGRASAAAAVGAAVAIEAPAWPEDDWVWA